MDVMSPTLDDSFQRKAQDLYPQETPREAGNKLARRMLAAAERDVAELSVKPRLNKLDKMVFQAATQILECKIHKHVTYEQRG